MRSKQLALALTAITVVALVAPDVALAASSLNQMINNLRVWLTGFWPALATVLLIVGAVRYLGAGHDPGQPARRG